MSVKLPDAPTYQAPITVAPALIGDHYEGNFSANWLGWLLSLNRAVQDLQASIPISGFAAGPAPGPGPVVVNLHVTTRRAATLNVIATAIQTFVTAAPGWRFEIVVDGTPLDTGVISNAWQTVITMMFQVAVGPGNHTVSLGWTATNANATLNSLAMDIFPAYTA